MLVSEARSKLQPKLPLSYIGNALILHKVYTPLTTNAFSMTDSNDKTHTKPCRDHDIKLLAELASSVHAALGSVADETIWELISASAASDEWAANPHARDL
ncbi:Transferase [Penicillium samsonianum]|uniref:Transferase n=1 Tax=Penicillium samsonianum TaxID=1882272 RepID=UPI002546A972|nr:Transferase [Penicillium samsonianum]KAJ6142932.1 Transferase [Penicillium samsonianum]